MKRLTGREVESATANTSPARCCWAIKLSRSSLTRSVAARWSSPTWKRPWLSSISTPESRVARVTVDTKPRAAEFYLRLEVADGAVAQRIVAVVLARAQREVFGDYWFTPLPACAIIGSINQAENTLRVAQLLLRRAPLAAGTRAGRDDVLEVRHALLDLVDVEIRAVFHRALQELLRIDVHLKSRGWRVRLHLTRPSQRSRAYVSRLRGIARDLASEQLEALNRKFQQHRVAIAPNVLIKPISKYLREKATRRWTKRIARHFSRPPTDKAWSKVNSLGSPSTWGRAASSRSAVACGFGSSALGRSAVDSRCGADCRAGRASPSLPAAWWSSRWCDTSAAQCSRGTRPRST